jgi:hypothetical protein
MMAQGQFQQADAACSQALQMYPQHVGAQQLQKSARKDLGASIKAQADGHLRVHAYSAAEQGFLQALPLLHGNAEPTLIAATHHSLAIVNACFGHWGEVVNQTTTALGIPGTGEIFQRAHLSLRAVAHHNLGNIAASQADLAFDPSEQVRRLRDGWALEQMAQKNLGEQFTITVYLNERHIPIRGWSTGHLLPTDRKIFTHADGQTEPPYEGARHSPPNADQVKLPESWQYTQDWQQGGEGTDSEGFEYAFNWQGGREGKYDPKNGFSSCVRRRRYSRNCVRVTPQPVVGLPSGGSTLCWMNGTGCIDLAQPQYQSPAFVPSTQMLAANGAPAAANPAASGGVYPPAMGAVAVPAMASAPPPVMVVGVPAPMPNTQ